LLSTGYVDEARHFEGLFRLLGCEKPHKYRNKR